MHIASGTARMGIGLRRQMGLVLPMRSQVFRLLRSQETDSYEMVRVFSDDSNYHNYTLTSTKLTRGSESFHDRLAILVRRILIVLF